MKIQKFVICGTIAIAVCSAGVPSFAVQKSAQPTLSNTAVQPQPIDSFNYSATYEILFNPNGGHFVPMTGKLSMMTSADATLADALPTPVRDGYYFDGWYTLPYGESGEVTNTTVFTKDMTVYAHWSENLSDSPILSASSFSSFEQESPTASENTSQNETVEDYTITFDGNGGTPEQQTLVTSNKKLIILPTVAREGYRFLGWSVQEDGGGMISTDFTFSQDTTVHAQWQEITYANCYGDWSCPVRRYTDLSPQNWYHDGVHYMIQNQFMIGMNAYTFEPNAALTRGMLVQILYNQAGSPEVSGTIPFWDISGNEWYAKALTWAYSKGIAFGYADGRFAANDPITREQLAQMLYANVDRPTAEGYLNFPDWESISSWAIQAIVWANQNHMLDGRDDNGNILLDPSGNATRAESAVALMKYKLVFK